MALRDPLGAFVPGVPRNQRGSGALPNLEGQVLSSRWIREVTSDRPQPSAWKDRGRDGPPPAPTAHPGGRGKKEEEAAVMGDARGVKTGPGPPAWRAQGRRALLIRSVCVRTQLPLPGHVHPPAGIRASPRQGQDLALGRAGEEQRGWFWVLRGWGWWGECWVAPSAITERSLGTCGRWHCHLNTWQLPGR